MNFDFFFLRKKNKNNGLGFPVLEKDVQGMFAINAIYSIVVQWAEADTKTN